MAKSKKPKKKTIKKALAKPVTRRNFLLRGGIAGAGALVGGGYTLKLHRSAYFDALDVKAYDLKTPKWPPYLPRLKIAFLTDLHVGCMSVDLDVLEKIVTQVNALKVDIILLGGDFIVGSRVKGDNNYVDPRDIAQRLKKLHAKLGVFSVLGNHDWVQQNTDVWPALEAVGIKVLENESVYVPYGEKGFYVVGLADYLTRRPTYRETMAEIQNDLPKIVLSHDPYTFKDMPSSALVQLSGHTHGGQVSLPFIGPIINPTPQAPLRWMYGMIEEKGNRMIISSGVGTSTLPVKNTPNEVVLVTIETSTTLAS